MQERSATLAGGVAHLRRPRRFGIANYDTPSVVCLIAMATRKKAEPEKEQPNEAAGEEILQKAAKAIGSALGTMAVKTGIAHPAAPKKKGKLVKKAKARLPRKEKKQAKKKLLNPAP